MSLNVESSIECPHCGGKTRSPVTVSDFGQINPQFIECRNNDDCCGLFVVTGYAEIHVFIEAAKLEYGKKQKVR